MSKEGQYIARSKDRQSDFVNEKRCAVVMNKSEIIYRQIFVSGKVQGVFFRETTRQLATELNLGGGVRNLRDGRVEVQVAGENSAVQTLIKWLETGPKLAKVSTIDVLEIESIEQSSDFLPQRQKSHFEIWATK